MDNTGDISKNDGTGSSKASERGGEEETGFRDRAPILGSKLAGKLDFGP